MEGDILPVRNALRTDHQEAKNIARNSLLPLVKNGLMCE